MYASKTMCFDKTEQNGTNDANQKARGGMGGGVGGGGGDGKLRMIERIMKDEFSLK